MGDGQNGRYIFIRTTSPFLFFQFFFSLNSSYMSSDTVYKVTEVWGQCVRSSASLCTPVRNQNLQLSSIILKFLFLKFHYPISQDIMNGKNKYWYLWKGLLVIFSEMIVSTFCVFWFLRYSGFKFVCTNDHFLYVIKSRSEVACNPNAKEAGWGRGMCGKLF